MSASPRYEHVIWDWNGTLLDDVELVVDIMNGLLAPRRLPVLDVARYREIFRFPVRDYYERLGFAFEREPFEDLAVEFIEQYMQRWPEAELRPGSQEALVALADSGVTQSVLSAAEAELLAAAAGHFAVDAHMTHLVGIDDHHAVTKVEHGRVHVAELRASRVLLVGDTEHDVEVAGELVLDCVLLTGGHMSEQRLAATGAPVVPTLDALLDWMDGVEAAS